MLQRTFLNKVIWILMISGGCFIFNSCDKNFLTRYPEDQISNAQFWNGPDDARMYVNQFYAQLPSYPDYGGGLFWDDNKSDNMIPASYNTRMAGYNTINAADAYWDSWYSQIRDVNFMLNNFRDSSAEGKIYLGEDRFFRAYFYYQLVKMYGAVPWISEPLNTESPELYQARTDRNIVIDSILADLDFAIDNLPPKSQAEDGRLNKESALIFKSRVSLFEGTWEKYHQGTVFGVKGSNGQKYLKQAMAAAEQLINMGTAHLYSTGNPYKDYRDLFNQNDLSDNPEILLWKRYDVSLGLSHNLQAYLPVRGSGTGLSKSLVESYLCTDGKPISTSPLYEGDNSLKEVIENRDPRLRQTIWIPGDTTKLESNGTATIFQHPELDAAGNERCTTGYQLKKGASTDPTAQYGAYLSSTAYIIFRYAEALLNYVEAKAELARVNEATFTQADLDMTINKIRARVDMPPLQLNNIPADPDWNYPGLGPLINEIRRERRVEFSCEGYRMDDILRWNAAGKLITNVQPLGAKFQQDEFPNMTLGKDIYVNQEGYIEPYKVALPNGWGFRPDRDYLLPIPPREITLNDKLTPNPGW